MLNIRPADLERDALAIMAGAKDFAARVAFGDLLPQSEEGFTAAVGRIVTLPGVEILVVEHDEQIVAGIGLLYVPFLWNPDLTVADELFWWASKDAPYRAATALLTEAMTIIRGQGAVPMFRALSTSPQGVDRLYQRLGLMPIETAYVGSAA